MLSCMGPGRSMLTSPYCLGYCVCVCTCSFSLYVQPCFNEMDKHSIQCFLMKMYTRNGPGLLGTFVRPQCNCYWD